MRRRWPWLAAALAALALIGVARVHRCAPPAAQPGTARPSPALAPAPPRPAPPGLSTPAVRTAAPVQPASGPASGAESADGEPEPAAPAAARTTVLADGTRLAVRVRRTSLSLDAPAEIEMQLDDGSGRPIVSEGERLSVLAIQGDRVWRGGVFEDGDHPGRYWTHLAVPGADAGALDLGVAVRSADASGPQGGVGLTLSFEP